MQILKLVLTGRDGFNTQRAHLGVMRMRFDIFLRGEALGAECLLGDADVAVLRFGVEDSMDLRLPLERATFGD